MIKRRTLKAYGIALSLLWFYVIAGVALSYAIPGDTNRSGSDRPVDVRINTGDARCAPAGLVQCEALRDLR